MSDVRTGVDPRLLAFADAEGLVITAGRNGKHNPGSKHYRGLAIDVSVRHDRAGHELTEERIAHLVRACQQQGLHLRDERSHPAGQAVWSAPHAHIEVLS